MIQHISEHLRNELQFFVGKLCTILTTPTTIILDNKTHPEWFTVMIDGVDQEAIIGTDVNRKTKHVFFLPHIISIAEEQVITADHPDYQVIKEKMHKLKEPNANQDKLTQPASSTPDFLPIDKLAKQAADFKKKWQTSSTV